MPARRPERLYGIARAVLDVTVDALAASEAGAPARAYVSDGPAIAWDCEQVVVTVEGTFGHKGNVAVEDVSPMDCLLMRGVTLGVWVVRCAPTIGETEEDPPPADDIDANAAAVLADPMVILDGIADAYRAGLLVETHGMAFQNWTGIGPEGGLVGGVLRVRFDLTAV